MSGLEFSYKYTDSQYYGYIRSTNVSLNMSLQLVALFALVAVAYANPGGLLGAAPALYAAPAVAALPAVATNTRNIYRSQDVFGNYAAGYSVADGLTGDIKVSHEQGIGGAKIGSHSQLDPNGYIRTTDYVADAYGTRQVITGSENGLYVNAKDHAIRPNAVYAAAPVIAHRAAYAAPVIAHRAAYAAPALAAAPVLAARAAYAAPLHSAYAAPFVAPALHSAYAAPLVAGAGLVAKAHIY